jgi:hypothetical protein
MMNDDQSVPARNVRFAEQPLNRALRCSLLDVLAPGRQIASRGPQGILTVARPADASILEEDHASGSTGEGIGGDHGDLLFNWAAPK